MNQGENINNKNVSRLVDIHPDAKQITFLDTRFYKRQPDVYYPSVTYILSFFPKGKYFETWLKDVGHSSEHIANNAAKEGTQVHNAIEKILDGEEIFWLDEYGTAKYSLEVWNMILKFVEFWTTQKPKLIASEFHIFSDKYKIAGTIDLVLELNDKLWLIDIKTSNSVHTAYELQVAAYAQCWNESVERKIDHTGILWLKSTKHGPDKQQKKIQGRGWELKAFDRDYNEAFQLFECVHTIFNEENKNFEPSIIKTPLSVKLEM